VNFGYTITKFFCKHILCPLNI